MRQPSYPMQLLKCITPNSTKWRNDKIVQNDVADLT